MGGSRFSVPGNGGATAMVEPWLMAVPLSAMGVLQVAPQLVERVNTIMDCVLLFRKSLKVRYTLPAGMVWLPVVPSGLVKPMVHVAEPRGTSTPSHGLSRN